MASQPAPSTTRRSVFEGLFQALPPDAALAARLRDAGYDASQPKADYPTSVWHACLDLTRMHHFGDLPVEEGYRKLGHRFMQGFFDTLVGKMLGASLPILGGDGIAKQLPRFWSHAQPSMRVHAEKEGAGRWRVTLVDEAPILASFCAGLMEVALHRADPEAAVDVVESQRFRCVLRARWPTA